MSKAKPTVVEYLNAQIALCGKSQVEIASDVGYDKPNLITMIKQGKTKLPINKVEAFAKSLGVDPMNLLRIVMGEYSPDAWKVIESILGNEVITQAEMNLVQLYREASEEFPFELDKTSLNKIKDVMEDTRERARKIASAV